MGSKPLRAYLPLFIYGEELWNLKAKIAWHDADGSGDKVRNICSKTYLQQCAMAGVDVGQKHGVHQGWLCITSKSF